MFKNKTISRDNLKAIHNIACSSWKSKLEEYAKRNPFENEISLSQSEIYAMFKASDSKQIDVLKKFFSIPTDIRDRVKSFIDACDVLGISKELPSFLRDAPKRYIALYKLETTIKALNEGYWPNWENENEFKYWNWFKMKGGFSSYRTYYYYTYTTVPSALYFKSRDLAYYVGNYFIEEYKNLY